MNKIKVVENRIIPFDNSDVMINNDSVRFINNGDYYIEYIDSNNVNIAIELDDDVCVNSFE